jgi:hypothetical protein
MHVTDIVVSWKLGSNCIVCIETGWCCVCGFRVNLLKFICTICLVVCKHIRSQSNKFLTTVDLALWMWWRSQKACYFSESDLEGVFSNRGNSALVAKVAESKDWTTRVWAASIFRSVIFVLTELLHVYFGRSNVVFAILFCFVQNKFVFCKAIVGFYFGIVRDDILAVIVFRKTICFWLCRRWKYSRKLVKSSVVSL